MAMWTSRGMDKFLAEEFGLDPLEAEDATFVNVGTDIYRILYRHYYKKLHLHKYNLEENQPWKSLASVDCFPSNSRYVEIKDVCAHEDNIFVFFVDEFDHRKRLLECFVAVYSTLDDSWTLPSAIDGIDEGGPTDPEKTSILTCRIGDYYLYHCYNYHGNIFKASCYTSSQVISPLDNPIDFRVFNFATREWDSIRTHFEAGLLRRSLLLTYLNFHDGKFTAGPDKTSAYLFVDQDFSLEYFEEEEDKLNYEDGELHDAYRLNLRTKLWSIVRTSGSVPSKVRGCVVGDDFVYGFSHEAAFLFRFDPSTSRWAKIRCRGAAPKGRWSAHFLYVSGKILVIGGGQRLLPFALDEPSTNSLWFRPMIYNMSCFCNHCKNEKGIGPTSEAEEERQVLETARKGAADLRAKDAISDKLPILNGHLTDLNLRQEDATIANRRLFRWIIINDVVPSSRVFFDLHVLDLAPTLKTLALVIIADVGLDVSTLPSALHVNLNTMAAFNPDGRLRNLEEEERKLVLYGKGEFRRLVVEDLRRIGAYDVDFRMRFHLQRLLEVIEKPASTRSPQPRD